jgi:hypothetical protein
MRLILKSRQALPAATWRLELPLSLRLCHFCYQTISTAKYLVVQSGTKARIYARYADTKRVYEKDFLEVYVCVAPLNGFLLTLDTELSTILQRLITTLIKLAGKISLNT